MALLAATLVPSIASIVRKFAAARSPNRKFTLQVEDGDGTRTIDISDAAQAEDLIKEFLSRTGDVKQVRLKAEDETRGSAP